MTMTHAADDLCNRCGIPRGGHMHSQAGIICSDGGHFAHRMADHISTDHMVEGGHLKTPTGNPPPQASQ